NPFVGPLALPGVYSLRLTVDGQTATTPIKVLPDARVSISDADLKAQFGVAISIRDEISRVTKDVRELRSVRQQLTARNELLKDNASADALVKGSTALIAKLDELEAKIQNPKAEVVYDILAMKGGTKLYSRMSSLYDTATDSDGAPTQGVREVFAEQRKELDGYEAELKRLLGTELGSLNDLAKRLDLPIVISRLGK